MIKSFLDFITGRSHRKQVDRLLSLVEEKEDDLDCALWWIDQLEEKNAIALQKEQEKFAILANYVDRMASAIAGTEIKIFDNSAINVDTAIECAIASALEQNSQLLHARIRLAELKEIVKQIPSDLPP